MRRVREDLSALFGSIGRPGISTFVCWGWAALAYPLATKGSYAGAVGAAIVLFLSMLFLAFLLGSGALAFVEDATRSCLPGSQRLARRANLLATASLLPPLALTVAALAGNPVWPAWVPPVLVLATALGGMLAPRRPTFAVGVLLLVVLTACWTASGRGDHEPGKQWFFALLAAAIVLLTAAVPLLAAVEWRRVIRRGSRPRSLAERLRTICMRIDQPWALTHGPRVASSRHGSWERQAPVQVVRTCLGGMFVQLSRQLIIGAMLLALFIVAAIGFPWLGASGLRWVVGALALTAAGLVSAGFLTQISKLTREQLAELALMPGLGAPAAQRRALCSAVISAPLLWLGIVLLSGSAGLLFKGEPLSSVAMLALCIFIIWLAYAIFALQKLATFPPRRQSFIGEFMLFYIWVYASYLVYAAHFFSRILHLFWWAWIIPVLISAGIAAAIGISVRRLATAPHPFLS
ncbi:MAG: hypothetical protein ACREUT_00025 [Steroidobacteraceae bacterium]